MVAPSTVFIEIQVNIFINKYNIIARNIINIHLKDPLQIVIHSLMHK